MKLPSLVKLPKYKRFDFQPRYYDPIKEEIRERVSKIEREMKDSQKPNFKFERQKEKIGFGFQTYLVIFMMLNLFLFLKFNNLSNILWILIICAEAAIIYIKIKTDDTGNGR